MATNEPYGDNARKDPVGIRSQRKTKVMGEDHWTKQSHRSGEFMAQKKPGARKFKGIGAEARWNPRWGTDLIVMTSTKKQLNEANEVVMDELAVAKSFVRHQKRKVASAQDKTEVHCAKRELRTLKDDIGVLKRERTFVKEAIEEEEKSPR